MTNTDDTINISELHQRQLAAVTERAERAEVLAVAREIGADLSASEVQRAEQQIATLTHERDEATGTLARIAARLDITPDSDIPLLLDVRLRRYEHDALVESAAKLRTQKMELLAEVKRVACERDGFIVELASAKALDAQARTDWERLTRALEAERLSSRHMKDERDLIANQRDGAVHAVRDATATLAKVEKELEAERAARSSDHMLFAKSKAEWETELEAERAGSAAMRKALETIAHCSESFRPLVRDVLSSSTAGAEMLAELRDLRQRLTQTQLNLDLTDRERLAALERLRKAEAERGKPHRRNRSWRM